MFTVIIAETKNHKIAKYQEFKSKSDAKKHAAKYGGFIHIGIISDIKYTTVNMITKTLTMDSSKKRIDNTMNLWLHEMKKSDLEMNREREDSLNHLIDYHNQELDSITMTRLNNKKLIRSRKP